ncbi:MAG: hypothetical protein ACRD2X_04130 [Vicinamibacteraceae bacterium]
MAQSAPFFRSLGQVLAAVTANCVGFRRRWREAAGETATGPAGCWVGEWKSERTGHHGRLRCVLRPLGDDRWQAWFHATYFDMLRACYAVELQGQTSPEGARLRGQVDLGSLAGGLYEYDGHASSSEYHSSYECQYDRGTFSLWRA